LGGTSTVRVLMSNGRSMLYSLLAWVIRLSVPRGENNATLILKIDALGDFFIWLSSGFSEVSVEARTGGSRSVILVRTELADFVRSLEMFDETWPLDVKAFRQDIVYRAQMLARLRRYGFARVLQMRLAREYLQEDAITRVVDAPDTWSPVGDYHNMLKKEAAAGDLLYHGQFRLGSGHELERNGSVTQALTGRLPTRYDIPALPSLPLGVTGPYYIIAPGAGWDKRRWPAKRFADIARRIEGWRPVIVGTLADAAIGDMIAGTSDGLNLCRTLELSSLAALVRGAAFVIANESAVSHMAAYFGVPSVAILGGGHYGWFMPYPANWPQLTAPLVATNVMPCFNCNWRCIYKILPEQSVPCIERVTVEQAWEKIVPLLAKPAIGFLPA
jgi:hypothetical protein